LAGLDDAPRVALAQAVEGAAAGAVDAAQAQNVDGNAMRGAEGGPGGFGGDARARAGRDGERRALLVHPVAGAIAIDADGGEINEATEPGQARREIAQHGIAGDVRRDRGQRDRGAADRP
jgi:hypothetical protein